MLRKKHLRAILAVAIVPLICLLGLLIGTLLLWATEYAPLRLAPLENDGLFVLGGAMVVLTACLVVAGMLQGVMMALGLSYQLRTLVSIALPLGASLLLFVVASDAVLFILWLVSSVALPSWLLVVGAERTLQLPDPVED